MCVQDLQMFGLKFDKYEELPPILNVLFDVHVPTPYSADQDFCRF